MKRMTKHTGGGNSKPIPNLKKIDSAVNETGGKLAIVAKEIATTEDPKTKERLKGKYAQLQNWLHTIFQMCEKPNMYRK